MNILTISDGINNGKGENKMIIFKYHCFIYNCYIKNKFLIINNKICNLLKINKIIFNFNEDLFTYNLNWDKNLKKRFKNVNKMIQLFKNISILIKKYYPYITIYQDPNKCFDLGDKILTYNKIKDISSNIIKIPKYKKINNIDDINNINFYPVILKISNGSHSKNDCICNNKKELINNYNKYFKNKKNIICVEFINSYIKELKCNHCIRFMIINNKITDYYFRPSNKWNIHTNDQLQNKQKIIKSDLYFKLYFNKNIDLINEYIDNINNIYGNGFYSIDLILNNNKLYICEIGLKNYDYSYVDYLKKNNIVINKNTLNKYKLKKIYYNIIYDKYI